jgi:hypothetical protein
LGSLFFSIIKNPPNLGNSNCIGGGFWINPPNLIYVLIILYIKNILITSIHLSFFTKTLKKCNISPPPKAHPSPPNKA